MVRRNRLPAGPRVLLLLVLATACARCPRASAQLASASTWPLLPPPCPRLAPGSVMPEPVSVWSTHGVLEVVLNWQTTVDQYNNTLYCYMMTDGLTQSPILRVNPGDRILITLNNLAPPADGSPMPTYLKDVTQPLTSAVCGASKADASSTNMHFHGTTIRPACEQVRSVREGPNWSINQFRSVNFPVPQARRLLSFTIIPCLSMLLRTKYCTL